MFRIVFFLCFVLKFRIEKRQKWALNILLLLPHVKLLFSQICLSMNFGVLTSVLAN